MKALGEKGHPLEDQGRWLLVAFNPCCGCVPCCLLMLVFPLTAPGMEFFYHFIIQSLLCRGAGSSEHPKMPHNNLFLAAFPLQGFSAFGQSHARVKHEGLEAEEGKSLLHPWEAAQALESIIDMALPSACLNLHK